MIGAPRSAGRERGSRPSPPVPGRRVPIMRGSLLAFEPQQGITLRAGQDLAAPTGASPSPPQPTSPIRLNRDRREDGSHPRSTESAPGMGWAPRSREPSEKNRATVQPCGPRRVEGSCSTSSDSRTRGERTRPRTGRRCSGRLRLIPGPVADRRYSTMRPRPAPPCIRPLPLSLLGAHSPGVSSIPSARTADQHPC